MRLASVARRANLSREALRKMENGTAWFSINVAARVCDAMGLEICRRTRLVFVAVTDYTSNHT